MRTRQPVFRAIAPAVCVLLTACSGLPRLPPGHELAISLATDSQPDISVVMPTSSAPAIAGGAIGAGAGVAASVGCGLLVFICLPLFALGGGTAGGAAGAMAGAPESAKKAAADEMRERLLATARRADAIGQLSAALNARARLHWVLVASSPTNNVTVHVTAIWLHPAGDGGRQMSLGLRAIAVMTAAGSAGFFSSTFEHTGPPVESAQWMEQSGEFVMAAITRACEDVAQQIVGALVPP